MNATRHGILSTNPVIPEIEQQSDWEALLAGQIAALKPQGDLELALAHRVALTLAAQPHDRLRELRPQAL